MRHVHLVRLLICSTVAIAICGPSTLASGAGNDRLRINFDQGQSLAVGTLVSDVSGSANNGVVRSRYGGTITRMTAVAAYPSVCSLEPCPNALIEINDAVNLNPGKASFEWGATIELQRREATTGQNIIQKGTFDGPGQWKLQVDNAAGQPSCKISGFAGTRRRTARVVSSQSVADGHRHQVTCRRTSGKLDIIVDGVIRGSTSSVTLVMSNSSPVTIGARNLEKNNDQFYGRLDDVFMRLI